MIAAALILRAFCSLSLPSRQWKLAAMGCVAAITLANLAVVFFVWGTCRADYAAMIESFRRIDKGSLVRIGSSEVAPDLPSDITEYPIFQAPTLAVHFANAVVPNLFTAAGKQPLRVHPDIQRIDIPYGDPVPMAILSAIAAGKPSADTPAFIVHWHRDFDYLYVLGPRTPSPLPARLQELASSLRSFSTRFAGRASQYSFVRYLQRCSARLAFIGTPPTSLVSATPSAPSLRKSSEYICRAATCTSSIVGALWASDDQRSQIARKMIPPKGSGSTENFPPESNVRSRALT